MKDRIAKEEAIVKQEDEAEDIKINAEAENMIKTRELEAKRDLGFSQKSELESRANDRFQAQIASNIEKRKNAAIFGRQMARIGR